MDIAEVVRVPYTTRPHMSRNVGHTWIAHPQQWYLDQKREQLAKYGTQLYGTHLDSTPQLITRLCEHLHLPSTDSIVEFAQHFQEDVALLQNGTLVAVCFCFPSGWVPRHAVGKSLQQIHQPVADGRHLVDASPRIAQTIQDPDSGSFRRSVWTINKVGELSNHPQTVAQWAHTPLQLRNLYFRQETQTTYPVPGESVAMFCVNVEIRPLIELWDQHRGLLLDSINSMTPAVLEYKNMVAVKDYLNAL